jgi:hypothetical protein
VTEAQGVCTDRANFHANLAIFGKTNMTNPAERSLLRLRDKYQFISPIENRVFLYDVAQLYDVNTTRTQLFKKDLKDFLGLQADMPEPKNASSGTKPKYTKIDICQPKFDNLRTELVAVGKRASLWIRKYFLNSDQVFVSSRDFFEESLKEWKLDPCAAAVASRTVVNDGDNVSNE